MFVLLLIVIDYFNNYTHAHSLDIADQVKIIGEPPLIFLGL
jgi:hypothetical protein